MPIVPPHGLALARQPDSVGAFCGTLPSLPKLETVESGQGMPCPMCVLQHAATTQAPRSETDYSSRAAALARNGPGGHRDAAATPQPYPRGPCTDINKHHTIRWPTCREIDIFSAIRSAGPLRTSRAELTGRGSPED